MRPTSAILIAARVPSLGFSWSAYSGAGAAVIASMLKGQLLPILNAGIFFCFY